LLGLVLFFMFGYLVSFLLFKRLNLAERMLSASVISIFGLPLNWLIVVKLFHLHFLRHEFVFILVVELGLLLVFALMRGDELLDFFGSKKRKMFPVLIIVLILAGYSFFTITRSHVIDSGDANYYMQKTVSLFGSETIPRERPLFLVLSGGLSAITGSSVYFVFRWLMILLTFVFVLPYYLMTRRYFSSPKKILFGLLLLLGTPTLLIEMTVARPQSIFIVGLPFFIYLMVRSFETKNTNYLVLAGLLTFSGLLFHELFVATCLVFVLSLPLYFWGAIKKRPAVAIGLVLWAIVTVYPYLTIFRISSLIEFGSYFFDGGGITFRWWFLNKYVSVASDDMSWIGWNNVIKYYAYYFGPVSAGIIAASVYLFIEKKKMKFKSALLFPSLFIAIFFFNAELFPRFNLGYLPERSWLFLDLAVLFFAGPILRRIEENLRKKYVVRIGLTFLMLVGLGGAIYVADVKGAQITEGELAAAKELSEIIPDNAIVITQEGNRVLFEQYAKLKSVVPPEKVFTDEDKSYSMREFISGILSSCVREKNDRKVRLEEEVSLFLNDPLLNNADLDKSAQEYKTSFLNAKNCSINEDTQIFVAFSLDKEQSYLAGRPYFRKENFLGTHLEYFKEPLFKKVFESNSMVAWRVSEEYIKAK